ncbi:uncharacterized protein H6S33_008057 [Morchella sextelata]|uniref:uncharacterized protein n=1 Tax=Morchella sextelata TaxID=1174677 RepID=UPI001D047E2D|nr:uncharacterized protein H6S33_008057 [Morchella sextelata]KAH0603053.1 hypothetical protein H6S33_008057 [Morchella sextelata]
MSDTISATMSEAMSDSMSDTTAAPARAVATTFEERLEHIDEDLMLMNIRRHDNYRRIEKLRYDYTVSRNGLIIKGIDPSEPIEVYMCPESFPIYARLYLLMDLKDKILELEDRQKCMHVKCFEMRRERDHILNQIEKRILDNGVYDFIERVEPERAGSSGA